jgi:hypothetical protein
MIDATYNMFKYYGNMLDHFYCNNFVIASSVMSRNVTPPPPGINTLASGTILYAVSGERTIATETKVSLPAAESGDAMVGQGIATGTELSLPAEAIFFSLPAALLVLLSHSSCWPVPSLLLIRPFSWHISSQSPSSCYHGHSCICFTSF